MNVQAIHPTWRHLDKTALLHIQEVFKISLCFPEEVVSLIIYFFIILLPTEFKGSIFHKVKKDKKKESIVSYWSTYTEKKLVTFANTL